MSIPSAILDWITGVTGLDTWQNPIGTDQDKPLGDYSTFMIASIVMSEFNQLDGTVKDVDFITKTTKNNAVILLSVNVFSINGYDELSQLNASGDYWQTRVSLAAEGITIGRLGNPQNLTGLGDTDFVDRWQMDIELRVTIETQNDWDRIKQWQLTGRMLRTDDTGIITGIIRYPLP